MDSQELLYGHSSVAITVVLFLLILLFNEIGFHIGRFVQGRTSNEIKSLTGSIQASILGLLALLLGFTFSMSMQRYDHRNQALIEEANDIGTAVLRAQLLPEPYKESAASKRKQYNQQITTLQSELWSLAVLATNVDPRPVTTGAFVTALNDLIDSQGKRNAQLQMYVPEVVLFLLFIMFVSSGGILGYSSGLGGKRVVAPTALVSFLIALIVFIIIDLDRPKRGLIQVDQSIMLELRQDDPR